MKTNAWPEVNLIEIAAKSHYPIGDGNHGAIKPSMYTTSGIPYIRVADIVDGEVIRDKLVYISLEVHQANPKSRLIPGDIVISKTGATIGKAALIPPDMKEANTTSSVGKVAIDCQKAMSKFVLWYMRSPRFQKAMWAVSHKSAQPGFNINDLKRFKIPLPPLKVQERIVKLLDEADGLCKLRAQANQHTAFFISALFYEMFGEPKHSWLRKALGELVQEFRYGTSNKSTGEGKPTLRIPNVVKEVVNLDGLKYVPVTDSEFERLKLKDGDLLFVRTNGNADYVGRCAVFDAQVVNAAGYNAEDFIYASYLIRARLKAEQVSSIFVQHFLTSPEGCQALRARSKTSAGQFNINTEGLATISIPVPPLLLQKEFADRVKEIRGLESIQSTSRKRLDDLFQSMLHRAFEGEL